MGTRRDSSWLTACHLRVNQSESCGQGEQGYMTILAACGRDGKQGYVLSQQLTLSQGITLKMLKLNSFLHSSNMELGQCKIS